MTRGTALIVSFGLILGACSSPPSNTGTAGPQTVIAPEGISSTGVSKVSELSIGMTQDEVATVLGAYRRDVTVEPMSCRSYPYVADEDEETEELAHVYFRDGKLIAASDGHTRPCGLVG